ncbi:MAG: hypothetical protein ACRECQ_10240 [Burkholderiaceae bacterium]
MSDFNAAQIYSQVSLSEARENSGGEDARAAKRGGGWLAAFAIAMGKLIENAGNELIRKAENIGTEPTPADSTMLTVESQEYSMFVNAVSTALKTMGEAQAAMAKRN